MKSERCKAAVMSELNKLGLQFNKVKLGEIELKESISDNALKLIDIALRNAGLELMVDKKNILIERIICAIHQMIYFSDDMPKMNLHDYLSKSVNHDYNLISSIFSEAKGVTIEKYVISQKIERVKELLVYEKLSLTDIAFKLQYSSVAHLSNQFKKITGLTPTFFRQLRIVNRDSK